MNQDQIIEVMQDLLLTLEDLNDEQIEAYQACLAIVRRKDSRQVRDKLAEFFWEYKRAYVEPKPIDRELGVNKPWAAIPDLYKQFDVRQSNDLVLFLTALARNPDLDIIVFAKDLARKRRQADGRSNRSSERQRE